MNGDRRSARHRAGDHARAVGERIARREPSHLPGDPLDHHGSVAVQEDAHGTSAASRTAVQDRALQIGVIESSNRGEQAIRLIHVRAIEAEDDRLRRAPLTQDLAHGAGHPIHVRAAAEHADEDHLHARIRIEHREGRPVAARRCGAGTAIEKAGRPAAVVRDHVHRRHGHSSASRDQRDIAFEGHIGVLHVEARAHELRLAQPVRGKGIGNVGLAEMCPVVADDLRVQRLQFAVRQHRERIDLDHRAVAGGGEPHQIARQRHYLLAHPHVRLHRLERGAQAPGAEICEGAEAVADRWRAGSISIPPSGA